MYFFDNWIKNAQQAILGPRCLLCHTPATLDCAMCAPCRAELPWLVRSCMHCALALPDNSATTVCAACARRPRFDAGISAFAYQEPIRWLIARLKFGARLSHARLLGDLLAARVDQADIIRPDMLVPVPLHAAGYRRRGFNQAEHIAARLARGLDLPLACGLVERVRDTARQSELGAARRTTNVRNAFACARPVHARHIAIVDDVVTTTHTAAAVAAALRAAGAERIDIYCVARA